jgi:hypothetical protein
MWFSFSLRAGNDGIFRMKTSAYHACGDKQVVSEPTMITIPFRAVNPNHNLLEDNSTFLF